MEKQEVKAAEEKQDKSEANCGPFKCPPNTFAYTVKPGDTFFTIAKKFDVSLDALIAANPQIPDPSKIVPGQIVCVPSEPPPVQCPPDTFAYTVQPGDTMFSIAKKFGVSLDALIAANPQIPDPSKIVPGQIVCVPSEVQCPPNTFAYTVQPGDSMFSIAQKFGVSLDALIAANPQIPDPSQIFPGQIVCVPTEEPPVECPPNTFAYTVQPGDSMFSIAQKFGVSLDALIAANPQIPDPNLIFPGQIVCVPIEEPPGQCPPNTFAYTVQPGDSMFSIAQKFGVSLDALIAANPQIPDPNKIFPGQIVCVPTEEPPGQCPPNTFAYTVQPGDSMFSIAQKFGVSLDALIAANPQIPDPNKIFPGQIVCVPTDEPPVQCPPNTFAYTVQPGDSMWLIAQKFGVSLDALIAANPQIPDPSKIFPGQIVCVPTDGPPPGQCPPNTFAYTVQPGDSMWLIAQKFGVSLDALIAANPQIPDPSKIFPGQIVCVPTTSVVAPKPTDCPPNTFAYTVKAGDSMFSIAQRFGVSLNTLISVNPQIKDPSRIKPGQIVCVPKETPVPPPCPAGTFKYTVQPGDTAWKIAQRFGINLQTLIAANPHIEDPSKLTIGQVLCVPKKG